MSPFKKINLFVVISIVLLSCNDISNNKTDDKVLEEKRLETVELVKQEIYKKDFLWQEKVLDEETGDSIIQINTNKTYMQNMPDDEKAAIVFVLSFIENGCNWEDGSISMDDDKLICKGLSALGIDYQNSPKHISFLKSWFANDTVALKEIANCPRFFAGTTIRTTIKSIVLERHDNKITVIATKTTHNSRVQKRTESVDVYTFISDENLLSQLI